MENLATSYLRVTSCLEIERAGSGHPGIALGGAPIIYSIYKQAFVNPDYPHFINRDRIVFSAGHASALIYACMHLFKFKVTNEELKNFRRIGSLTTGHPEVNGLPGIDASTGPLGQGIAMAVGMAIAEEFLRNKFQKGNLKPIDHYTYCFCGDGCLMEGVAQEAITIAGNLRLNKLILLYDKNDITIEGSTSISNKEVVKEKFIACNWNVIEVNNGNDVSLIDEAIIRAKQSDKPTIIIVKTQIGYGSEFAGKSSIHGKPLNSEQIKNLRQNLNYFVPDWEIPSDVEKFVSKLVLNKKNEYDRQQKDLVEYKKKYKEEYEQLFNTKYDFNFKELQDDSISEEIDMRHIGHEILNNIYDKLQIIGGSADLAPSTQMFFDKCGYFDETNRQNRNIAYGVREHAMGAISNGLTLHGGLRAFCSTFFSFSNYLTPAIRMSALMKNPVLYIFTHDSVATGEDGPTHQPIEQLATMRAMPDINVFRPVGRNEMLAGFEYFFKNKLPMALLIPRQHLKGIENSYSGALRGGYKIVDRENSIATIVSTGSDVVLVSKASDLLEKKGIIVDIVSVPCVELFEKQDKEYKNSVIGKTRKVICVESSNDSIWYKYASSVEDVIKMETFGISGRGEEVMDYFGFTPEKLAEKIEKLIK